VRHQCLHVVGVLASSRCQQTRTKVAAREMNDPNRAQLILRLVLADLPKWASPLYIHIVIELLHRSSDFGDAYVSNEDLAKRFNVSVATIKRAFKEMCDPRRRWVSKKSGKRGYKPNTYSVNVPMLPVDRATKLSIISLDATNLAGYYHVFVKNMPKTLSKTNPASGRMVSVRVAKDWQQRWERNAQKFLDEGYTYAQIEAVIGKAFSVMPDTAKHGMQCLREPFKRLLRAAESQITSASGGAI